jgi:hypothetical protein
MSTSVYAGLKPLLNLRTLAKVHSDFPKALYFWSDLIYWKVKCSLSTPWGHNVGGVEV